MDTTARGFAIKDFEDSNGVACSIQKSSVATEDMIWLGPNGAGMHLTRAMAAEIAMDLNRFAATGRLETSSGKPPRTAREPDPGLGPKLRNFEDEPGVFEVLNEHFRKQRK